MQQRTSVSRTPARLNSRMERMQSREEVKAGKAMPTARLRKGTRPRQGEASIKEPCPFSEAAHCLRV